MCKGLQFRKSKNHKQWRSQQGGGGQIVLTVCMCILLLSNTSFLQFLCIFILFNKKFSCFRHFCELKTVLHQFRNKLLMQGGVRLPCGIFAVNWPSQICHDRIMSEKIKLAANVHAIWDMKVRFYKMVLLKSFLINIRLV